MTIVDRKTHWQTVYETKAPDEVSWFQPRPDRSLALIQACGLAPDAPIVDVGGGASTLVDHLLEAGHSDVSVLDISAAALATARARLGARAERVDWIETDITAFRPARSYALWHDRAVFHFLVDADDRRRYVAALTAGLAPGGHLILAAFAVGGPEKCSGLPIVQYDAPKLIGELGPEFELVEQQTELHRTPAGREQAFNYFRCVRRGATGERQST